MKIIISTLLSIVPFSRAFAGNKPLPAPMRGIVVPLVTPLTATGTLDRVSLGRLIDHVLGHGVNAVMLLGSNGEGPALNRDLQIDVIKRGCRAVGARAPVLVNVSANALSDSILLAQTARTAGASAVVLSPPSYFTLSQDEMLRMIEHVAGATPLPLFLYNIPSMAHQGYDVDTVVKAMNITNVVGIKDSSGDRTYLRKLLEQTKGRGKFTVMVGSESVLADGLAWGAHGGVCGSGNVRPQLFAELYAAVVANDAARVAKATHQLDAWKELLKAVSPAPNAPIAIFKAALKHLGILSTDHMSEPLSPLSADELARLRRGLTDLGRTHQDH